MDRNKLLADLGILLLIVMAAAVCVLLGLWTAGLL